MAKITAEHLVKYLEQAGFVVMKKPRMKAHSIG
jgi:predicted RNA binding protein YcfA (HicA-like mRNA interferase family)